MSKHGRYGRNQKRQHREQIAVLRAQLAAARAHQTAHENRADSLQAEMADVVRRIRRIAHHSYALAIREDSPIGPKITQLQLRAAPITSIFETTAFNRMPVTLQLTHVMFWAENNRKTFERYLHLRIRDHAKETDRRCDFAVTPDVWDMLRRDSRLEFCREIASQMGSAIWRALQCA